MAEFFDIIRYVLIPAGILVASYLYLTRNFGYWKCFGIPEVPPLPFTGSHRFELNSHQGKMEQQWYKKYGKIFGAYEGANPVLFIADPELLKDILVKNFHIFPEKRDLRFGDPITDKMLFVQSGERSKELRAIISPAFSSGKMRIMSKLINDCGKMLIDNLKKEINNNRELDVNKFFTAYIIDVISRCAFGIKIDSCNDPNNDFVKTARNGFRFVSWRVLIGTLFPGLAKLVQLSVFDPSTSLFFKNVVLEVIQKRKREKEQSSKDFLQFLMDAEKENQDNKDKKRKLDVDEIVAQCIMFFLGGFFQSSATLTFIAHQLAVNPDVQQKLIKEIDDNIKDQKDIDYDLVNGMKYLDAFVQEILRYYCPTPRLFRKNIEDYKLGKTGIVIPKSTLIIIPIYALSHDPDYFSEPEKFNPDRFLPENKAAIHPYANLPFGTGPRGCLGMRFAMMELKIALVNMLQQIIFKPGINTKMEPEFLPSKGFHSPQNVFLNLQLRKKE